MFHDANEMFGRSETLSPLVTAGDTTKPIISKVLAVPALRAKYIGFVGVGVLLASLFLTWFETSPDNRNAQINGARGEFNAFDQIPQEMWDAMEKQMRGKE